MAYVAGQPGLNMVSDIQPNVPATPESPDAITIVWPLNPSFINL